MKSLKIIFFGSPYYSVPLLDKTIELGHDVSLVVSQGTTKTRRGNCLLYTSPSPRDRIASRMPSSA